MKFVRLNLSFFSEPSARCLKLQNQGSGALPACREAAEEINAGEASGFVLDLQFQWMIVVPPSNGDFRVPPF